MATMPQIVDEVREFNRFYTRVVGLLRPDLAGSPFGLTEARVLFELAHSNAVTASDLRRELDLDAGYLSRILGAFTAAGLIDRERSGDDGRRQILGLTDEGRQAFVDLDRLQVDAINALLAPLDEGRRQELVTSMGSLRRALDGPRPESGVVIRAPQPGDLGWVIERHGARYAAEYGWDVTFESLVARVVADVADRRDTQREAGWIAERDGARIGCVFCTATETADTAQLRLLLVEPSARGLGIGTRLVDECLWFARASGYKRITLWTNDVLSAARRIYEHAGFQCDRREAHHSFGHDLVGEYWSRDLS
jgi:DNA-binding MarR family transcriptional regulator/N-acetylglutamate synthase-like GNAT family acetyltransferase